MRSLKLSVLVLAICLFIGSAQAAEQDDNLCYTTHAGHCYTDLEWQVGWYWANNPPSAESCARYHELYPQGDFWGMCSGINWDTSGTEWSQDQAELAFSLTSQWHELPEDESSACPFEGLDPIIDYENNTYVCATSF